MEQCTVSHAFMKLLLSFPLFWLMSIGPILFSSSLSKISLDSVSIFHALCIVDCRRKITLLSHHEVVVSLVVNILLMIIFQVYLCNQ